MDEMNNQNFEEKKPTNKKLTVLNFLIIAVIFIGLFIYMMCVDGIDSVVSLLVNADLKWVLAGIVCMILWWLCEALVLHIPLKKLYPRQRFSNSMKITMVGQVFNNITPFSSGGQPMQVYHMHKDGKKVSDSFSILSMKFIVTQTALVLFTIFVMFFEFNYFVTLMDNFLLLAIIGFSVNIFAILFIFLIGVNKQLALGILKPIYHFLGKIHIFKNVEEKIEKLSLSVDNFSNQFHKMKEQKLIVIGMFIASLFQCLFYYSITYMVYRSFGNSGISIFNIIPAQAFLLMLMTFIPTPGAGIGAEGGFLLIFDSIFQHGTINMSILFWRIYTFYLPILIGSLFLIPSKKKSNS